MLKRDWKNSLTDFDQADDDIQASESNQAKTYHRPLDAGPLIAICMVRCEKVVRRKHQWLIVPRYTTSHTIKHNNKNHITHSRGWW